MFAGDLSVEMIGWTFEKKAFILPALKIMVLKNGGISSCFKKYQLLQYYVRHHDFCIGYSYSRRVGAVVYYTGCYYK